MPRFRKNILVGEEEMNFSFTPLNYPDGMGYFVTVSDKNRNIYSFDLKQKIKGEWTIVKPDKVPGWIIDLEKALGDSVNEVRSKVTPIS
jgi:hypothetical protein